MLLPEQGGRLTAVLMMILSLLLAVLMAIAVYRPRILPDAVKVLRSEKNRIIRVSRGLPDLFRISAKKGAAGVRSTKNR